MELDGKVAVITGAGSGMGTASTRIFVREGARVVAVLPARMKTLVSGQESQR